MVLVKLMEGLRTTDHFSFYINLLSATFTEMSAFIIIIIMFLVIFALAIFIQDMNSFSKGVETFTVMTKGEREVPTKRLGSALFYTYMLTLGEVDVDQLLDSLDPSLAITMFICMTFLMQVVFLNMLIAIMSDTFDKVKSQQKETILKDKIVTICDYTQENQYRLDHINTIFIFKKNNTTNGDDGEWTGKIQELKSTFK